MSEKLKLKCPKCQTENELEKNNFSIECINCNSKLTLAWFDGEYWLDADTYEDIILNFDCLDFI